MEPDASIDPDPIDVAPSSVIAYANVEQDSGFDCWIDHFGIPPRELGWIGRQDQL
jgi:hypothetical protein